MRYLLFAIILFITGCKKEKAENPITDKKPVDTAQQSSGVSATPDNILYNPAKSEIGFADSFKTYIIRKGNNYCDNNDYALTQYTFLHFRAILDSSCIYATVDPTNQADINKLFGFADCASHHQTNSTRFGWNWENGAMHIHAYCYAGTVRNYKELGTVALNKAFDCKLYVLPDKYVFELEGKKDTMTRGCADNAAIGYKLLPYFGGNEPGPHEVRVKIREM
ncbi:MAG TPA: hypothetical protein VK167_14255 [Flavipsychrobacter sp.]|nr:hypothetical protein [Flavipsychrobacter sp.]